MRSPRCAVALLAVVGFATACHDIPTAVAPREQPKPGRVLGGPGGSNQVGSRRANSQFVCNVSDQIASAPSKYRFGRLYLTFPRTALADDGSYQIYRYQILAKDAPDGSEPFAAGNCRIPNTPEAVQIMDRRLGIESRRRRRKAAEDGIITTQDCPAAGCPLEPLIAYGYARTYSPPAYGGPGSCYYTYCGGWAESYYSYDDDSGGYFYYDPGDPADEPCETGDSVLDSQSFQNGMEELWRASNTNASLHERKEAFGWIVKTSGGYRIDFVATGTACSFDGEVRYPAEGPDAIAVFIHTHPYYVGETIYACDAGGRITVTEYEGIASDWDRVQSVELGQTLGRDRPLTGMVLDGNGISIFQGTDTSVDRKVPRCGY